MRYIQNLINSSRVKDLWQILRRPSSYTRNLGCRIRLNTNNLNLRVLLLQKHACTHDCTCRTHWRDKMSNISLGISVNLWTSWLVMGVIVIRIWELIEHFISSFGNFLFGIISRALNTFGCRCQNDFSTISLHCLDSLFSWVFWHYQFNIQIKHSSDHGQGNTGVSTCRLNQFHSRLDFSSVQGFLDHIISRSILDTSSWVLTLEFCENSHIWASEDVSYLDHWSVSNDVLNIVGNFWSDFVTDLNLRSMEDLCVRGHWFGEPNISTDYAVMTNYRVTA